MIVVDLDEGQTSTLSLAGEAVDFGAASKFVRASDTARLGLR